MTPETKARLLIDGKLEAAGWVVQDMKQLNLGAGPGVAVREYPTDTGPADYILFVDRAPVGVIEAKRDEEGGSLHQHETQTERYANATLKWRKGNQPLRFLYESTGQHGQLPAGFGHHPFQLGGGGFGRPAQSRADRVGPGLVHSGRCREVR